MDRATCAASRLESHAPASPSSLQIKDAPLLAGGADTLMKIDGFADTLFDGKTAGSKHFKLANIAAVEADGAGKRPQLFDFIRFDPHHP